MCGRLLLALCVLLLFPVLLAAEQQYLITETQLQNIEKSTQILLQDNQNSQLLVQNLNQRLEASEQRSETAEKLAETFNNQLKIAREQYRTLQTSFNKYEASQLEIVAKKEAELQAERTKREAAEKQRNTFIWLFSVLAGLVFFGTVGKFFIKKLFKI